MNDPYSGAAGGHGIASQGGSGRSNLRSAKEFAEMIVDTVREGLLVLDLDLRVQAANESFYEMFGVTQGGTEGQLVYELGDGQWDIPELRELLERILPERHVFNDLQVVQDLPGRGRRVMLLNARQLNHHAMVLLAIEDVTERLRDSEALRASELRYRTLFNSIDEGFCVIEVLFDADGEPSDYRFLEANPAFERHTGLACAVGQTARELIPGLEDHWVETYGAVALTGEPARFEQGSEAMGRWFDVEAFRVGDPELRRVALLFTDITERKAAEQALRNSEARYRALFMQAPAFIAVLREPDHRFEFVNPAYLQLVGDRDLLGKPVREAFPELEGQGIFELLDRVYETGEPFAAEDRPVLLQRAYGREAEERYIDFVYQPLQEPDGTIGGVITLGVDITERVRAQQQRDRAYRAVEQTNEELERRVEERTEQVRRLASTLSVAEQEERRRISQVLHDDLQQQLYGIQLKVQAAQRDAEAGRQEALVQGLAQAEEWLRQGIELTRSLTVDLSPPLLESDGLADALRWLARQMREKHGLEVEVKADHSFSTPEQGMRVLLLRLVRELLFNVAKHAGTPRATVELRDVDHYVEVRVSDEGAGFDVAAAEAAMDGGFGLFSVRERLRFFGGRMDIESEPGRGTRVAVGLPLHLEEA